MNRPVASTIVAPDGTVTRDAGPAVARNLGAGRARHDIIAFVDADVLVHPDAFTRMRAAFADPELTAVFGSYDDAPEDPVGLVGILGRPPDAPPRDPHRAEAEAMDLEVPADREGVHPADARG